MAVTGAIAGSAAIGIYSADRSASAQEKGAKRAARSQEKSNAMNIDFQREVFEQQREDAAPWREAGIAALNDLSAMIDDGQIDPGEFKFEFSQEDPSYNFRFNEGMKAIENRQQAMGLSQSGAAMKELMRYGQDMAKQEYNNEFNRDVTEYSLANKRIQDIYNRIAGVAGTGQQATSEINNAANAMAGRTGDAITRSGIAQANAFTQAGNAQAQQWQSTANATNQALGNYMLWDMYGNSAGAGG